MSEQFWYTACPIGFDNLEGYQIRAASQQLHKNSKYIRRELGEYLSYTLPKGETSYVDIAKTPISLNYIFVENNSLLLYKKYTGFDYRNRPGVYFIHGINELPINFNARDAIQLWNATDLWKSDDKSIAPNDLTLPAVPEFQLRVSTPPSLDLRDAKILNAVDFLLKAVLLCQTDQRVFIYAPSEEVASIIYAVTLCLPDGLLQKLTFSTFESNVLLDKKFVITGGCRSELNPVFDLPSQCYQQLGFAINLYKDATKQSSLPNHPKIEDFVSLALKSLQSRDRWLVDYLEVANAMQAYDSNGVISAFEYFTKPISGWSLSTVLFTLEKLSLAKIQLPKPEFRQRLLELIFCSTQPEWLQNIDSAIRSLTKSKISDLTQLAEDAQELASKETLVRKPSWDKIIYLLDGLATAIYGSSGNKQLEIWQKYFNKITQAINSYSLEFKLQVLGRIKSYKQNIDQQGVIDTWLRSLSKDSIQIIFENAELPPTWKSGVLYYALIGDSPSIRTISLQELKKKAPANVVDEAVWDVFGNSNDLASRKSLFDKLLEYKYDTNRTGLLLQMVKRLSEKRIERLIRESDDLMMAVLPTDQQQTDVLLDSNWTDVILKDLQWRTNAFNWVTNWIGDIKIKNCNNDKTRKLLQELSTNGNLSSHRLSYQAKSWLDIANFIQSKDLNENLLKQIFQKLRDHDSKLQINDLIPSIALKIQDQNSIKVILRSIPRRPDANGISNLRNVDEPTDQDEVFKSICGYVGDNYNEIDKDRRRYIVVSIIQSCENKINHNNSDPASNDRRLNYAKDMFAKSRNSDKGLVKWMEKQGISQVTLKSFIDPKDDRPTIYQKIQVYKNVIINSAREKMLRTPQDTQPKKNNERGSTKSQLRRSSSGADPRQSDKRRWLERSLIAAIISVVICIVGLSVFAFGFTWMPPNRPTGMPVPASSVKSSTASSVTLYPTTAPTATPSTAPTATPSTAPTATPSTAPTATPFQNIEFQKGDHLFYVQEQSDSYLDILFVNSPPPKFLMDINDIKKLSIANNICKEENGSENTKYKKYICEFWSKSKDDGQVYLEQEGKDRPATVKFKQSTHVFSEPDENIKNFIGTFRISGKSDLPSSKLLKIDSKKNWWQYQFIGYKLVR